MAEATAENVQRILASLFAEHGPPLVRKSDNGSAFIADSFRAFLAEHEVTPLYSPPWRAPLQWRM